MATETGLWLNHYGPALAVALLAAAAAALAVGLLWRLFRAFDRVLD